MASDLSSTTYIDPNKSFVLGEGRHGSYKAKIINKGKVDIEVFVQPLDKERVSVGVLKPNAVDEYRIEKDTKVIFKNLGDETATIGIKLSGDTSLSMGYKPNVE